MLSKNKKASRGTQACVRPKHGVIWIWYPALHATLSYPHCLLEYGIFVALKGKMHRISSPTQNINCLLCTNLRHSPLGKTGWKLLRTCDSHSSFKSRNCLISSPRVPCRVSCRIQLAEGGSRCTDRTGSCSQSSRKGPL